MDPVSQIAVDVVLSSSATLASSSTDLSTQINGTSSGSIATSSLDVTSTLLPPNMGYVGDSAVSASGAGPSGSVASNSLPTSIASSLLQTSIDVQSTSLVLPLLSVPIVTSSVTQPVPPISSAQAPSTPQDVTLVITSSTRSYVAASSTTQTLPISLTPTPSFLKPSVLIQPTSKSVVTSKTNVVLTYTSSTSTSNTQPSTYSKTISQSATSTRTIPMYSSLPAVLDQTSSSSSRHSTSDINLAPTTISTSSLTMTTSMPALSSSVDTNATATYVSAGVTLTGQAAVAALAAAGTSGVESESTTSVDGGKSLSSFAIIGIVAGAIGFLVILWVIWYLWLRNKAQKGAGEDQEEFHSGGVSEEKRYDENGRTARCSFDDVQDPFDEEGAGEHQEWYDDSHYDQRGRGHDTYEKEVRAERHAQDHAGNSYDGHHPYDGDEGHDDDYREDYDNGQIDPHDGTLTAYADNLQTSGMTAYPKRNSHTRPAPVGNPFESDLPQLAALARTSSSSRELTHRSNSQFGTDHSVPPSVNYEDIYGDYECDESRRPETRYGPGLQTASPETPATSTLLPWLAKDDAAPPPPKAYVGDTIPGPSKGRQGGQGVQPAFQPYEGASGNNGVRPGPPRAVMAQTPAPGADLGWQGVIPTFRS